MSYVRQCLDNISLSDICQDIVKIYCQCLDILISLSDIVLTLSDTCQDNIVKTYGRLHMLSGQTTISLDDIIKKI